MQHLQLKHRMYIDIQTSRCIANSDGTPSKIRLVLITKHSNSAAFEHFAVSRWVYLSVPHMTNGKSWDERLVNGAWHPLSLASQSSSTIELLIDVHTRPGGVKTWSETLYDHVGMLQYHDPYSAVSNRRGALQRDASEAVMSMSKVAFPTPVHVNILGPFGSSFSRCFEMMERRDQVSKAKHDVVVLFGSGIGLPSALSALHEFVRRRRDGVSMCVTPVLICAQHPLVVPVWSSHARRRMASVTVGPCPCQCTVCPCPPSFARCCRCPNSQLTISSVACTSTPHAFADRASCGSCGRRVPSRRLSSVGKRSTG